MSAPAKTDHLLPGEEIPLRVTVLYKGNISWLPPALKLVEVLARLGCRPTLITGETGPTTQKALDQWDVEVVNLHTETRRSRFKPLRLLSWLAFQAKCTAAISRAPVPTDLLWICGAETALAMWPFLRQRPYILQLNELHDQNWAYLAALRPLAHRAAAVVVPSKSRAAILRTILKLQRTPFALPNQSVHRDSELPSTPLLTEAAHQLRGLSESGKRTVLYQGHIDLRERSLLPLLRSSVDWPSDWQLVLMGRDQGYLDECLRIAPKVIPLPFQEPPGHLMVTRFASVGVCCYEYDSLNSIFCAPNKIWEYSAWSLPMLCNDVPGLSETVGAYGAGMCVDFADPTAITLALHHIFNNESEYRANSKALFESCDVEDLMLRILQFAQGGLLRHGGKSLKR